MIRSRKVDASHYIEMLSQAQQNQSNMLLELVMEDYINFMADLISTTDIMDKFFYVVVPYDPGGEMSKENIAKSTQGFFSKLFKFGQRSSQLVIEEAALDDAKRELRRRGQVVIEGLQQCGVMGEALNTEELIELYYESYNPDTSGGHQLASLRDLGTPLVTRAGEPATPAQPAPVIPVANPPPQAPVQPPQPPVAQMLPPAAEPPMPAQAPIQYQQPVQPMPVQPQYPPQPTQQAPVQPQYPQPPMPPTQAAVPAAASQWPPQPMTMAIDPQLNPYPPV